MVERLRLQIPPARVLAGSLMAPVQIVIKEFDSQAAVRAVLVSTLEVGVKAVTVVLVEAAAVTAALVEVEVGTPEVVAVEVPPTGDQVEVEVVTSLILPRLQR
jgi:hypothetical protein